MRASTFLVVFTAGALAGCMASGPPIGAQSPGAPPGSSAIDFARDLGSPLVIDRTDLRIGTTVHFRHMPSAVELRDATLTTGLAHIVISLAAWPDDFDPLQTLAQMPEEADVIVILPGYPPNRSAAEAWNYVQARLRIIVLVPGPPPSRALIDDLNAMRGLERVIAQMNDPSRAGLEYLQRPLSFRKLMD